ncbi:hypothetical protein ABZT34_10680 [Streptomyces sp. NPDC005329]|uniref:hypothetical protein n=1 Tax=Streptomyces sp. NPDC005329 TaxID=3157034 RepID=UPI0033B3701A
MISKWEPGTRVRVKDGVEELGGWLGTIQAVNYAEWMEATSVLLDEDEWRLGAWFRDDELEEVTA